MDEGRPAAYAPGRPSQTSRFVYFLAGTMASSVDELHAGSTSVIAANTSLIDSISDWIAFEMHNKRPNRQGDTSIIALS